MATLTDSTQSVLSGEKRQNAAIAWLREKIIAFSGESPWEFPVLFVMTGFLLFYGLVPIFGGDQVGLVGADEPRYAQIAREMLHVHTQVCQQYNAGVLPRGLHLRDVEGSVRCLDAGTVTPILYGHPWLEKPALYYWRAMGFFMEFGADVTARGHKTGKRRGLFSLAAVDGDEDAGALSSGREHHIRNVAGCDPRIGEFALEHRANLFGEGAGDALAVVISGSVFRHGTSTAFNKQLRIPNSAASMLGR